MTLAAGSFKLILDKTEEILWISPDKPDQPVEIPALTELWGFGSGDFALSNDSLVDLSGQIQILSCLWPFPKRKSK